MARDEADMALDDAINELFAASNEYARSGDLDRARSVAAHAHALFAIRWAVAS